MIEAALAALAVFGIFLVSRFFHSKTRANQYPYIPKPEQDWPINTIENTRRVDQGKAPLARDPLWRYRNGELDPMETAALFSTSQFGGDPTYSYTPEPSHSFSGGESGGGGASSPWDSGSSCDSGSSDSGGGCGGGGGE